MMCGGPVQSAGGIYMVYTYSLVPRPSSSPAFDCLQYAKTE